jgi:LPXTG-motif cell wall-anchored protein
VRTTKTSIRGRRLLAAGATSVLLALGTAGVASAQTAPDQHSGGVSPNDQSRDPGVAVSGETVSRGSGLPVTGSDVAGLLAVGAGAVAVGSAAVVASRRRASNAAV